MTVQYVLCLSRKIGPIYFILICCTYFIKMISCFEVCIFEQGSLKIQFHSPIQYSITLIQHLAIHDIQVLGIQLIMRQMPRKSRTPSFCPESVIGQTSSSTFLVYGTCLGLRTAQNTSLLISKIIRRIQHTKCNIIFIPQFSIDFQSQIVIIKIFHFTIQ